MYAVFEWYAAVWDYNGGRREMESPCAFLDFHNLPLRVEQRGKLPG